MSNYKSTNGFAISEVFQYDLIMKLVKQSLIILASFLLAFLWHISIFSQYTIEAVGVILVVYILLSARNKKPKFISESPFTIFALTTIVLLLIFETGGFNSSLFFLLYFIIFGVAFIFDPRLVFVFAAGAVIIFAQFVLQNDVVGNLIKLGSLLLVSPLAYFFGSQRRGEEKLDDLKERAKDSADTISKDVEGVLKDQKQSLPPQDVEKMNEVLEETEDLRSETKE